MEWLARSLLIGRTEDDAEPQAGSLLFVESRFAHGK